ncbi:MAG: hypothetical protein LBS16_01255 [Prevotellaceae bacterium]|nr:hypothetical protein [Prevotellaceae bacterium]
MNAVRETSSQLSDSNILSSTRRPQLRTTCRSRQTPVRNCGRRVGAVKLPSATADGLPRASRRFIDIKR